MSSANCVQYLCSLLDNMPFAVKILGTGSASPLKNRHHSAQLLMADQHFYLIDCGEGTQYRLVEQKVNMNKIDAIFISHLHGDHYLGLVGLISTMALLGRKNPLKVFGPPGLLEIITVQFQVSRTVLQYPLSLHEVLPNDIQMIYEDGAVTVSGFPLVHGIPTNGYLFQEQPKQRKLVKEKLPADILVQEMVLLKQGQDVLREDGTVKYAFEAYTYPPALPRAYAYCSDTCFDEKVIGFVRGVNTLYHEATYLQEQKEKALRNNHATAKEAGQIARLAGVGKLLIGHLSSRYEGFDEHLAEAQTEFANVEGAVEGKTFLL